ncbi:putative rRNA maturation factor [Crenobacter luteus]|uniref:rRNA maturation RNase YbeY n=1 Tax=Crenobacter luteus TaxID=1452487 RepID=UPI0010525F70|nr:rRNA maturation RNase YbeY [Crenobacter luteus]TCP10755.1 putative rRNA maturation factor [Crenobacter luteus]
MKSAKRNPAGQRLAERLTLTVENRSGDTDVPSRADFARWARAALTGAFRTAEVSLTLVDDDEGRALNRDWRGKDYATNVLSFALNEGEAPLPGLPLIGDIVFATGVVAREAAEQNKALDAHYAHLTVHGMLHLQGYDHVDDDEAEAMEALESVILARLGYADPYAEEAV